MSHKIFSKILIFPILLLAACGDPSLTRQDRLDLQMIRNSWSNNWSKDEKEKYYILYQLTGENPELLAKRSAENGDYKLISLAMGYKASEDDAEILGVKCSNAVETQSLVFGCAGLLPVFLKLLLRYNIALMNQPGFPAKNSCKADEDIPKAIDKMEQDMDEAMKKESIRRWEEKVKKSKLYNN